MDDSRLAELLCARLCHDLAGPVGAAAAGAELAEDAGSELDAETLALVAASAAGAAARLKFFRTALGPAASAQDAVVVRELAEGYLRTSVSGGAVELEWRSEQRTLDGDAARLVLNLILLARDSLPRGGAIVAEIAAQGPGTARVHARGEPAKLGEEARAVLVEDREPPGPRGAHALFTRRLAERLDGAALQVTEGPGELLLSLGPVAE
jgi:histidine phosphotransferase ChpT